MTREVNNIIIWPAPFIFWTEVENHQEIKKDILPKIKEQSKNEDLHTTPGKVHRIPGQIPCSWSCEVVTSYFKRNESEYKNLFNEKLITSVVSNSLKKFFDDPNCPQKTKPKKTILTDIWFNSYNPGYWQEVHSHHGSTYSGIYILELNEENPTKFCTQNIPRYSYSEMPFMEYKTSHIKEGNVLLFPSEFPHSVDICSNERSTISFNILCEY